jgi:hypothetical protein
MKKFSIISKLPHLVPKVKSILVFYFQLTLLNLEWLKRRRELEENSSIVVSLATISGRQKSLKRTLKSLLTQNHSSFKIIIWSSNDDYQTVNKSLRKYYKYGITLRRANPNLGSFNKFHHIALEEQKCPIVTADDDIIYPRNWLTTLESSARKYPEEIVGLRGIVIAKNDKNGISEYVTWNRAETSSSHNLLVLNTGAGTFYPANTFNQESIQNYDFLHISPTGDDLWMFALAVQNKTRRRIADGSVREIIPATIRQKNSLWSVNVGESKNDTQFRQILEYFPDVRALVDATN